MPSSNHLEQLVAEWYEFQGYFVRRNVQVGRRLRGGHEGELDVVAFHPTKNLLVHIEASGDANFATREAKFRKKFEVGRKYIPNLFPGFKLPQKIDHIGLFLAGKNRGTIGGGQMKLVSELIREILIELKQHHPPMSRKVVPEGFPLLRTLQLVTEYSNRIIDVLNTPRKGSAMRDASRPPQTTRQ